MTPRTYCQASLTVVNVGIGITISFIVGAVAANASASTFDGRLRVWAAVSLALSGAAMLAGVWMYRAVGREWDRTEGLPPSGGENDGHDRPQAERLNP